MELNREDIPAIIFYNFRRGLTQQQCIDELNSIFGDTILKKCTVGTELFSYPQLYIHAYIFKRLDNFTLSRRRRVLKRF